MTDAFELVKKHLCCSMGIVEVHGIMYQTHQRGSPKMEGTVM